MSEEKKFTDDEISAFLGKKLRELEPAILEHFQDNLVFGIPFDIKKK